MGNPIKINVDTTLVPANRLIGLSQLPLLWHKGDIGALQQTSPHSITSSARASSENGTVTLRALAALMLITSSYLVFCSMGRSRVY